MTVTFEELEAIHARLAEINAVPFEEITWTRNGVPLQLASSVIDTWMFMGLSNASFVEFYDAENMEFVEG